VGDDKRLLFSAITVLVITCLAFAMVVVFTTKSRLELRSGDPLFDGSELPGEECGELMASAAKAVDSGHPLQAFEALRLVESLRCEVPFLVRSVQLYRAIGRPDDAIRLLERLLEENPEDPELLCAMAEALHETGYSDSARRFVTLAAELPGLESATVRTLAWLAVDHGESLLAESLFSRALDVEPGDPELWRALSQIRLGVGKPLPAKRAALRAIELDSELCSAYLSLGWAHEKLDEIAEAESAFQSALRLCPHDAKVSFDIGRFYFRSSDYGKAVPLLRRAVEEQSSLLEWMLLLARAEERLEESSAARQTLKLACSRYQDDYRPFLRLAKLERRAGNMEQSRALASSARALAPDSPEVVRFLAELQG
jgi:tetratricopeptide (TPR) repeat protein